MKTLLSLFLLLAVGASAATGIKISEYPNTPVLTNSELFIVAVTNVTPATNRNISYGQLRSLLSSNNFVGSFTGDGRNASNVVAAYVSGTLSNNISGNAATATNLVDGGASLTALPITSFQVANSAIRFPPSLSNIHIPCDITNGWSMTYTDDGSTLTNSRLNMLGVDAPDLSMFQSSPYRLVFTRSNYFSHPSPSLNYTFPTPIANLSNYNFLAVIRTYGCETNGLGYLRFSFTNSSYIDSGTITLSAECVTNTGLMFFGLTPNFSGWTTGGVGWTNINTMTVTFQNSTGLERFVAEIVAIELVPKPALKPQVCLMFDANPITQLPIASLLAQLGMRATFYTSKTFDGTSAGVVSALRTLQSQGHAIAVYGETWGSFTNANDLLVSELLPTQRWLQSLGLVSGIRHCVVGATGAPGEEYWNALVPRYFDTIGHARSINPMSIYEMRDMSRYHELNAANTNYITADLQTAILDNARLNVLVHGYVGDYQTITNWLLNILRPAVESNLVDAITVPEAFRRSNEYFSPTNTPELATLSVLSGIGIGMGATNPAFALDIHGVYGNFLVKPTGIGVNEIPDGIVLGSSGTSLNLAVDYVNGAAGKLLTLDYWDGSQYRSALEFANTASGFSTLKLMRSGGNVTAGGAVIATNAFVMPPVSAGPDWCTNGLAAIWNSNTTVYIRTSAVGATTFADKLMAP